jgi:hypothetical protein
VKRVFEGRFWNGRVGPTCDQTVFIWGDEGQHCDLLTDRMVEGFEGKRVRITIEEIEPNHVLTLSPVTGMVE